MTLQLLLQSWTPFPLMLYVLKFTLLNIGFNCSSLEGNRNGFVFTAPPPPYFPEQWQLFCFSCWYTLTGRSIKLGEVDTNWALFHNTLAWFISINFIQRYSNFKIMAIHKTYKLFCRMALGTWFHCLQDGQNFCRDTLHWPRGFPCHLHCTVVREHPLPCLTCPALRRLWLIRGSHMLSMHLHGSFLASQALQHMIPLFARWPNLLLWHSSGPGVSVGSIWLSTPLTVQWVALNAAHSPCGLHHTIIEGHTLLCLTCLALRQHWPIRSGHALSMHPCHGNWVLLMWSTSSSSLYI